MTAAAVGPDPRAAVGPDPRRSSASTSGNLPFPGQLSDKPMRRAPSPAIKHLTQMHDLSRYGAARWTRDGTHRRRGVARGPARPQRPAQPRRGSRDRPLDRGAARGIGRVGGRCSRSKFESRTLIKGLWSGDASEAETTELPASKSVEAFVTARLGDGPAPHPYLESPVVVDGHHLCTLCIANPAPRPWGARELQTLENATAAMVLEMRLRLANHDAPASTSSWPRTTASTS